MDFEPGSVVLVTGGARGVSGRVAVTLAERHLCHLEIVGDSPLPDLEDEVLAACADAATLRCLLVDRGYRIPPQIDAEAARILAGRETASTIDACERAGATVAYHTIAADDAEVFAALVAEIYEREGRIDGIVHDGGQSVLADALRADVRFMVLLAGAPPEAHASLVRRLHGPIVSVAPPESGVLRFFDELGSGGAAQVLFMPDAPELMQRRDPV